MPISRRRVYSSVGGKRGGRSFNRQRRLGITPELRLARDAEIRKLHTAGNRLKTIAGMMGLSESTVRHVAQEGSSGSARKPAQVIPKKRPRFFSRDMAPQFMEDFYSGKFTDAQLMEKYGISPTKFRELTGEKPKLG